MQKMQGAFFGPALPKVPAVGDLIHTIRGVMQNLRSPST